MLFVQENILLGEDRLGVSILQSEEEKINPRLLLLFSFFSFIFNRGKESSVLGAAVAAHPLQKEAMRS